MKKQNRGISSYKQYLEGPHPHIGEEYQAQLPALLSPYDSYRMWWEDTKTPEWSDMEIALFITALYIFGKDLFLVKEFMGCSKGMNELQSFYYGRFYNSNAYRRWAERRKSARDQKPLARSNLEKMFSLLHPHVPQRHREAAIEAHEGAFHKNPEKRSVKLIDYALLLKKMVGPEALIEGVRSTVRVHNPRGTTDTTFQVNDSFTTAREKKNLSGVDVDEGEASSGAKEKRVTEHAKRDSDRLAKKQKLMEPKSKPIRDEDMDREVVNEGSNDEVSESSNGRRRSRRSRVMSTRAVEAFETRFLGSG